MVILVVFNSFKVVQNLKKPDSVARQMPPFNTTDIDLPSTIASKILAESQPLTDDIKNFLLGTSDYARDIQSDIDLYVTRDRHNQAIFCRKLDPIEKRIWRTENPLALLFKDAANFDAQNPVIGSLLRDINLGKRSTNSGLIKRSPIKST